MYLIHINIVANTKHCVSAYNEPINYFSVSIFSTTHQGLDL